MKKNYSGLLGGVGLPKTGKTVPMPQKPFPKPMPPKTAKPVPMPKKPGR